ncbi:MAG: MFS transporter [Lachnospiraceae bacterium]|nr:MFS transporter [Lachnospiraceae bacterium]
MNIKTKSKIGILASCFCAMSYLTFAPVVASMAASFPEVSLSLVQMVVTLPSLMFIVVSPLSGTLMRRFAKKKLALLAVALYFISAVFGYVFQENFYLVLLGSAIMGCGTGLLMPVTNALICDQFEGTERSSMMGLNATFVAVGGLTFTFLSGQLAKYGWQNCYFVFFLILPLLLTIYLFLPREERCVGDEGGSSPNKGEYPDAVNDPDAGALKAAAAGRPEMNPYIVALFVIGFLYFCLQNAFNTNASVYVEELSLGGASTAGLVSMMNPLGGILGGVIFGLLAAKLGDQIETVALSIAGLGFLLAGGLPSAASILVSGLLVGIAFALFNAAGTFLLAKHLKPENNDITVAIYMAVVNLGAAVSPYVVNFLAGFAGGSSAVKFLLCGAGLILCCAVSFFIGKKR